MLSTVDPEIEGVLGVPLRAAGSEVRWCCPFCYRVKGSADTKYHLYYNSDSGKFFCQRCESGGTSLRKRLKILTRTDPPLTDWDDTIARFLHPEMAAKADEAHEVELEDYVPIFPNSDAWSYCLNRGITEKMMRDYWVGIGVQRPTKANPKGLAGRIILPDWAEGKLVYWTARLYTDAPSYVPRYKNPNTPKGGAIFNLERAMAFDEVDICEGPISAVVAGENVVCTYSKAYTAAQIARLARGTWKRYYVAYDGDAVNKTIDMSHYLWGAGKDVRMVLFDDHPKRKDPADIGQVAYQALRGHAVPYDPTMVLRILLDRGVLNAHQ